MTRTTTTRILATVAASAAAVATGALGAGAATAQTPIDGALGSVTAGSVGAAAKVGSSDLASGLPGQCAALDPLLGSLGIASHNSTTAVPGEHPGQTAFLVDQNLPSEGSSTTEDTVIEWKNEDTGATGRLAGYGEINWVEFNGQDVWGALVDTGAGRVTWTYHANEYGINIPGIILWQITGNHADAGNPYGGCGGTVQVP